MNFTDHASSFAVTGQRMNGGRQHALRKLWATGLAVGFAGAMAALPVPALADVIFSDDFNRADSTTVGNGWVESPTSPGQAVQITSNQLEMIGSGSGPATATHSASTSGFENILLDYDWTDTDSETGDTLTVLWSLNGTTFTLLATHDLGSSGGHNQVGLGGAAEDVANLFIRFQLDGNQGNDNVLIDNVVLSGDPITRQPPINGIPEPASLLLLGIGLAGLATLRRRKK